MNRKTNGRETGGERQDASIAEAAGEEFATTLHILPLTERPYFPSQTFPVLMEERPWLRTVRDIGETSHKLCGLVLARTGSAGRIKADDLHSVGTVIRMHNPARNSGKIQFLAEGLRRFRVARWLSDKPPFIAQVEYPTDDNGLREDEVRAHAITIINTLRELVPLNPLYNEELKQFIESFSPSDASAVTDFGAGMTGGTKEQLQEILETFPLIRRMEKVLVLLKKELDVGRLQVQIREKMEERMTEQQRKFFLREQLKEIQKELGIEKDDRTAELDRFRERFGRLSLPESAQKRVDDEMQKLSVLENGSPEYSVTRNYLDWITALPWGVYSQDKLDLTRARAILDRDHDSLGDVKDRIIEFLAVGALKGAVAGSIILLVGPPGVGKTSIGKSIAESLGRQFYRFSLGGMRDEAEIKGHRRTYIGAMPGKFVQAMKEAGTANPVIMLDELDKIGASFQGDPASALLEVLDPAQNNDFLDHYLDVRFDLSKVLFICTANQLDTIPPPLLDRMEIIRLSGYITDEKVAIAKHHLLPRQLEKASIRTSRVRISDAALRQIIEGYAREAGVRNLEKRLGQIVRKAAVQFVRGESERVSIGPNEVERYLGKPPFQKEKLIGGIGVVTGLAWTALGGATLSIEATLVHSNSRGLKLTGQLGEVMRESAEIAYSYVASHLEEYGGRTNWFDNAFVHLHIPEGATPKDGPSAGVTIATALLSLARGQCIKRPLAMTGELTLTGQVFPVGGIREKVVAARRAKVMELILPDTNRCDFEELPAHIKAGMTPHFVGHYREVMQCVFPVGPKRVRVVTTEAQRPRKVADGGAYER